MMSEKADANDNSAAACAIRRHALDFFAAAALCLLPGLLRGQSMTIPTPAGNVSIPLTHVGPSGSLILPPAPAAPPFTAPTIFSAPLPSGSGARALGVSGAFTAVADDATAASWNPAGLIQLERPEFSVVYRLKQEYNRHWSGDPDYRVGDDEYFGDALNYLSFVWPFRFLERNMVVSLNLQEVYDFTQRFHARFSDSGTTRDRQVREDTTSDIVPSQHILPQGFVTVTEYLTTRQITTMNQLLYSSTLGRMSFDQEGSIYAFTPALAVEVTPKFSLGVAVNVYQNGIFGSGDIRSHTGARYNGTMDSTTDITDERYTDGTYQYTGMYISPTVSYPISGSGDVDPYETTDTHRDTTTLRYEGYYDVYDNIDDFRGVNATFGGLWAAHEKLSLGACLDLPWTGKAKQRKTVLSGVSIADGLGTSINSRSSTTKDVEFDFPLSWSAGAAWHWNNRLTTSFDVSQTLWSQYSFKAEGEPRINPLDGSRHGAHPVDDCWALRTGTEYLWVLSKTEIPFRVGLSWEERPAIGSPDDYWGVSLGTGFSIGKGENKVIIDIAYIYSWGDDVMGTLVPGQKDSVGTDVRRHDLYLSCIYHF